MDYRGQVIDRFGKSMTCPPDLHDYEIIIVIDNLVNHITKHIKIKGKITHFATNLLILQQLLKKFRKFGERPCS